MPKNGTIGYQYRILDTSTILVQKSTLFGAIFSSALIHIQKVSADVSKYSAPQKNPGVGLKLLQFTMNVMVGDFITSLTNFSTVHGWTLSMYG